MLANCPGDALLHATVLQTLWTGEKDSGHQSFPNYTRQQTRHPCYYTTAGSLMTTQLAVVTMRLWKQETWCEAVIKPAQRARAVLLMASHSVNATALQRHTAKPKDGATRPKHTTKINLLGNPPNQCLRILAYNVRLSPLQCKLSELHCRADNAERQTPSIPESLPIGNPQNQCLRILVYNVSLSPLQCKAVTLTM